MRTPRQFWALKGGGAGGSTRLVFLTLENSKMRTPGQFWSGSGGVHVLMFWTLENSKMRTFRQFWPEKGGGAGGSTRFSVLGKVRQCVLPGNFGLRGGGGRRQYTF